MHKKYAVVWAVGIGLAIGSVRTAVALDKPATGGPDAAMMAQAEKYMTPGPEHKELDPLIGKWKAKVRMWMKPGDPAQESEGVAENTWVLNQHFVKQTFMGSWGGKPFDGTGYTGYDKVRNEYQSIWIDSMGTGIMYSAGPSAGAGMLIKQSGTFGCPMTGDKAMPMRSELKIAGPNQHTYTSYTNDASGKEFKSMEIVYTRT